MTYLIDPNTRKPIKVYCNLKRGNQFLVERGKDGVTRCCGCGKPVKVVA